MICALIGRAIYPAHGVEAEAEPVERAQPRPAAALALVGARERPPRQRDPGPARRLGRERQRPPPHHLQPRALGVEPVEQVEPDAGAEAARPHAQPGEPDDVDRAPARARGPTAPRSGCRCRSRRPSGARSRRPSSCGNVAKKCSARSGERRGPLVALRPARARRSRRPRRSRPTGSGGRRSGGSSGTGWRRRRAPAARASRSRRAAPPTAARSRARSRRRARRSGGSRARAAGRRSSPGAHGARARGRRRCPRARRRPPRASPVAGVPS